MEDGKHGRGREGDAHRSFSLDEPYLHW